MPNPPRPALVNSPSELSRFSGVILALGWHLPCWDSLVGHCCHQEDNSQPCPCSALPWATTSSRDQLIGCATQRTTRSQGINVLHFFLDEKRIRFPWLQEHSNVNFARSLLNSPGSQNSKISPMGWVGEWGAKVINRVTFLLESRGRVPCFLAASRLHLP